MSAMTHAGLQAQAALVLANMVSTQEPAVRAFLEGLSGGSPAMLPGNPDVGLIALCEEILATWIEYDQASASDAEESVTGAAYRKAQDGFDRLMAMPLPVTAAGRKAAARVALVRRSHTRHRHQPRWRAAGLVAGWPTCRGGGSRRRAQYERAALASRCAC